MKVILNLLVRKSLDELIIGDRSHFLFVFIMTNAELLSLKDAKGAITKQARFQRTNLSYWSINTIR